MKNQEEGGRREKTIYSVQYNKGVSQSFGITDEFTQLLLLQPCFE